MTALNREELLDLADKLPEYPYNKPITIALRHAWNWAVNAETYESYEPTSLSDPREDPPYTRRSAAAVSQAWSAIAEALK